MKCGCFDMKLGVHQIMAPRVKVMRLEKRLISMDDCGVIAADVGVAALAGVREMWRMAMMAVCGCLDVVMSQRNRGSENDGTAGGAGNVVERRRLVGEGWKE